jgi:hypothetical protein
MTTESQSTPVIGRNEPCPCRSGKKYKRCCGIDAAPKITPPKDPASTMPFDPGAMGNMDPQVMLQFSQALQRLPKGQLQKLQNLMQRAMSGKDVGPEAADFEKSLPVDFQNLIHSFQMPNGMGGAGMDMSALGGLGGGMPALDAPAETMTEEQARELVAKAAAAGKISSDQAASLLGSTEGESADQTQENDSSGQGKFGKFWKNIAGKKTS